MSYYLPTKMLELHAIQAKDSVDDDTLAYIAWKTQVKGSAVDLQSPSFFDEKEEMKEGANQIQHMFVIRTQRII